MSNAIQLTLPIHQIDDETLDNFYAENSLLLLDSLRQNFVQVQQPFFFVWGTKSSGKSHLLKAVSNHYLLNQRAASYIPLNKSHYFAPTVLDNVDQLDLICLDDLQVVAGNEEWELALFNVFNVIREQKRKTLLLISADRSPNQLAITLPDLRSRLNWGEVYQLNALNDDQKRLVLQRNAYQKGIELSDEVANFLLKRLDRDLETLSAHLAHLDQASLQAKRNLTVPFVKEILGL